jgi:hypothetical protein
MRYRSGGRARSPNSFSWMAIGFSAAYLVLALSTSFVFLGIVPVVSAVRAFHRREPLAPLAAVAAALAIGSAIFFLVHGHR